MNAQHIYFFINRLLLLAVLILLTPRSTWANDAVIISDVLLSDQDLSAISAMGVAPVQEEQQLGGGFAFDFSSDVASATGSVLPIIEDLPTTAVAGQNVANLNLQDHAQENLRSLVNINAVQSMVQVLLNLNVSINSSVGSISQGNIASAFPRAF